jgi:hypothetical protein
VLMSALLPRAIYWLSPHNPQIPPTILHIAMANFITADVGSYGKVKGFTNGNVAEFRGIPFATIPARFRRAERVTSTPGGTVDATKYGPYPTQPPPDKVGEVFLFGDYVKEFLAEEEGLEMSEDKCLNLNIVTPKNALGRKNLPVLVWIYGNYSIVCDMANGRGRILYRWQFEENVSWCKFGRTQFGMG